MKYVGLVSSILMFDVKAGVIDGFAYEAYLKGVPGVYYKRHFNINSMSQT